MKKIIAIPAIFISFIVGAVISHLILNENIEYAKGICDEAINIIEQSGREQQGRRILEKIKFETEILKDLLYIDKKGNSIGIVIINTAEELREHISIYETELRETVSQEMRDDIESQIERSKRELDEVDFLY